MGATATISTATAAVEKLKEQGADLIVALTHIYVADDRELAGSVKGIDLILGGHEHIPITYYERGTLIIDIWDAKKKQAIWRGSAEAVIKQNPQKAAKQIDKSIDKMVKRYQKMRAKDEKASR